MNLRRIFISVAILTAGLAALLYIPFVRNQDGQVWVMTARETIPEGVELAPGLIRTRRMPRTYAPMDVLEVTPSFSLEALRGWLTRISIPAGSPLTASVIRPKRKAPEASSRSIPTSVPVICPMRDAVKTGDRINIGVLHDVRSAGGVRRPAASNSLEGVLILATMKREGRCYLRVGLSASETEFLKSAVGTGEVFIGMGAAQRP